MYISKNGCKIKAERVSPNGVISMRNAYDTCVFAIIALVEPCEL